MPSKKVKSLLEGRKQNLAVGRLQEFFYYMHERHEIWYKRFVLGLPPPWTKDKILRDFKFTNVYRQLDRNTIWLITYIIANEKMPPLQMLWHIIVFRYFNNPEMFAVVGLPGYRSNLDLFEAKLHAYKKKHGRVFHTAYMVCPPRTPKEVKRGLEGWYVDHLRYVQENLVEIYRRAVLRAKTARQSHGVITGLPGIANFLGYEIYCDLTYTKWFPFKDIDFVNLGPGAYLGLKIIFPQIKKNKEELERRARWLQKYSGVLMKKYGHDFKYLYGESTLGLRCIEHSLCEYFKYFKMMNSVGKKSKVFSKSQSQFKIQQWSKKQSEASCLSL